MTQVGVLFERTPEGAWIGTCPSVPGALAQGRTLTACRRRLGDAIASILTHAPTDDLDDLSESEAIEARAELLDVGLRALVMQREIEPAQHVRHARPGPLRKQPGNGGLRAK